MNDTPILNGWKEIAAFLRCEDEATARRLAEKEGLPVFRRKGGVMASKKAIEEWLIQKSNRKP